MRFGRCARASVVKPRDAAHLQRMTSPYDIALTPGAQRSLEHQLSEAVAAAAIEFLTGALIQNPRRVGKPLRGKLAGCYSARRGSYRVVYEIDEGARRVVVLRIEHRRSVYR